MDGQMEVQYKTSGWFFLTKEYTMIEINGSHL